MDNKYSAAIAAVLRGELAARQVAAATVAESIGVSLQSMHRYMRGERDISAAHLLQALAALGVDPGDFMARVEREVSR